MNKQELVVYLEKIDDALHNSATLYIYGSAACILLDEPDRTSLDIDVAGPYSSADQGDLRRAAASAGLPLNPGDDHQGNHIEWVGPMRLCLQPPQKGRSVTLWQGIKLRIVTAPPAELVASKLIRYDEIDQSDIQYLITQGRIPFEEIAAAAQRLPPPFADDTLIQDNLENLRSDMQMWGAV